MRIVLDAPKSLLISAEMLEYFHQPHTDTYCIPVEQVLIGDTDVQLICGRLPGHWLKQCAGCGGEHHWRFGPGGNPDDAFCDNCLRKLQAASICAMRSE